MARARTYLQAHIDHRNLHVLTACTSIRRQQYTNTNNRRSLSNRKHWY